jgi:hypothetical protein
MSSAIEVLGALALAGTLGAAGQAVRAVGGLKKMSDQARADGVAASTYFQTSRFVISLIVGFVAGMVAGVSLGLSKLISVDADNTQLFLGLAAAGYGGTDFLEAFARRLTQAEGAPRPQVEYVPPPAPTPAELPEAPASTAPVEPPAPPRYGAKRKKGSRKKSSRKKASRRAA